jgi:arsenate reductase-like glutaredoxin family protein
MLSVYYKNKIKYFFNNLVQSKPYKEVLEAYFHKLPERIQVKWFRDGKFIVGVIRIEEHEYKTQALSADEFIEMVNDTLYTVYEIPNECINILSKIKRFLPSPDEFNKLKDNAIKHSDMSLVREKELVVA